MSHALVDFSFQKTVISHKGELKTSPLFTDVCTPGKLSFRQKIFLKRLSIFVNDLKQQLLSDKRSLNTWIFISVFLLSLTPVTRKILLNIAMEGKIDLPLKR